ncbi:hypothetical protein EI94DRAFT_1702414 [Lactarius quietus]|nr:hypothetical protein EI94DRAFT_1702414 [Lactarius quietus]
MDEDPMPIISNPPSDPTASREPGRQLMDSTQVTESQGSQSALVRVEVTVLRALHVPYIKTVFGGKREYFITVTYQATTKKAKKTKKTKSVQIEGQMAVWNETLDAFHGNGQAGQSTQPVTLNLTIIVPANRTSPSAHPSILNEGDDAPAEDFPTPAVAPDSSGPDQSAEPVHTLPRPDHISAEGSTPIPQDQGETSLVEKARAGLDLADEVEKSVSRSTTWEGVVGRVKWVMDTLSPVSGLHPIVKMAYGVLSVIPQVDLFASSFEELSNQYQRDGKVRSLIKSMHNAFDFTRHEDTLKSIKPNSKQAEILTLMLRD